MTAINWDRFARAVPAGTRVRCKSKEDESILWEGFLIENYPHEADEDIAGECAPQYYEAAIKALHEDYPRLRYQPINELHRGRFLVSSPNRNQKSFHVQYFIDGRWQSFTEIMHP